MVTGKLLGLLSAVIVVCIVASGLVGWAVANATLAGSQARSVAGATGVHGSRGQPGANGKDGSTGANGTDGTDGTDGATGPKGDTGPTGAEGPAGAAGVDGAVGPVGATGATGAQGSPGATGDQGPAGPTGATGDQGDQGIQGVAGPSGASAPTFAIANATGNSSVHGTTQYFGSAIGQAPTQIPAGAALVGFTATITYFNYATATCSLVDATSGAVIASASPISLSPGVTVTVSTTEVVTLAAPTTLQLRCSPIPSVSASGYTGLSVYAISFAGS